eukprot:6260940-Prymnesium_polylepis.1
MANASPHKQTIKIRVPHRLHTGRTYGVESTRVPHVCSRALAQPCGTAHRCVACIGRDSAEAKHPNGRSPVRAGGRGDGLD